MTNNRILDKFSIERLLKSSKNLGRLLRLMDEGVISMDELTIILLMRLFPSFHKQLLETNLNSLSFKPMQNVVIGLDPLLKHMMEISQKLKLGGKKNSPKSLKKTSAHQ